MNLSRFRIGTKLAAAFFVTVLLTVAVGTLSLLQLSRINANTEDIATNWLPSVTLLSEIQEAVNLWRRTEAYHVVAFTAAEMATHEERMDAARKTVGELLGRYDPLVNSPEERALLDDFKRSLQAYAASSAALLKLSREGEAKFDETKRFFRGDSRTAMLAAFKPLTELIALNNRGAEAAYQAAQATYASARGGVAALLLGAVVVATLLAWWITRLITRPLAQAVGAAERVAAGDLSGVAHTDGRDEPAQLLRALAAMNDRLAGIVGGVRLNADSVATASAQIAQGNADLSQRTEQQASALQETAAAMEQLSSTVSHNAANAKSADELARGASQVAVRGGEVVGQVVATMKGINDSSKTIADIITVIDGIAFQTNILALNAAVEAARAGEQGRGFAVVASEVRSLAQRSADAAKQIKQMITASVERVEHGSLLVDQAGATMTEVVQAIKRVTDIMGDISAASAEQSTGVAQVGEAVTQMDRATQQNAALVEQSAAAAASLQQQAQQLVHAVAVFKLAHGAGEATGRGRADAPGAAPAPAFVASAGTAGARAPVGAGHAGGHGGGATATGERSPAAAPASLAALRQRAAPAAPAAKADAEAWATF